MEQLRGKQIVVREATSRMVEFGICGLWIEIADEAFERVHYAPTESAVHRQQFINHEYGHMILAHEKVLLPADRIALLAPLIPMDAIVHALSRRDFTVEQEALAEAIGDELAITMLRDSSNTRFGTQTGFGKVL